MHIGGFSSEGNVAVFYTITVENVEQIRVMNFVVAIYTHYSRVSQINDIVMPHCFTKAVCTEIYGDIFYIFFIEKYTAERAAFVQCLCNLQRAAREQKVCAQHASAAGGVAEGDICITIFKKLIELVVINIWIWLILAAGITDKYNEEIVVYGKTAAGKYIGKLICEGMLY